MQQIVLGVIIVLKNVLKIIFFTLQVITEQSNLLEQMFFIADY